MARSHTDEQCLAAKFAAQIAAALAEDEEYEHNNDESPPLRGGSDGQSDWAVMCEG